MIRFLPLLLVLAACAQQEAPPPSQRAATAGATPELQRICTQEAERVVNSRERGQLMRADANFGDSDMTNDVPVARLRSDSFRQQTLRDELIRECIRNAGTGQAPVDPGAQRPQNIRGRR
ncbi:MAG: hypothetical protein ING02_04605 [Roseomonas sp.]|nr:hypothetical protein [Roseomonas sp.]